MTGFLSDVEDQVVAGVLCVMYLIAAVIRFDAARHNVAIRRYYLASVPLALFLAGSQAWVIFFGDSETRRDVTRLVGIFVVPILWIVPTLAAYRTSAILRTHHGERTRGD